MPDARAPIGFFDTHVHFDAFAGDARRLTALLDAAEQAGVTRMAAIGGGDEANATALELSRRFPGRIVAAVGYERSLAGRALDFAALRDLLQRTEVVAAGETGLDYFHTPETAPEQQRLFEQTLALAAETGKPAVVHTREADEDTLALLRGFAADWKGDPGRLGVLHCFTRDRSFARQVLDLGLYISYSGILTFANADALRETVAYVPDDRLLIETDTPYLTPVPYRGRRNEPQYVVQVAEKLADLKQQSVEQIARLTARNAETLFALNQLQ
jgi:TatD DNase family protein